VRPRRPSSLNFSPSGPAAASSTTTFAPSASTCFAGHHRTLPWAELGTRHASTNRLRRQRGAVRLGPCRRPRACPRRPGSQRRRAGELERRASQHPTAVVNAMAWCRSWGAWSFAYYRSAAINTKGADAPMPPAGCATATSPGALRCGRRRAPRGGPARAPPSRRAGPGHAWSADCPFCFTPPCSFLGVSTAAPHGPPRRGASRRGRPRRCAPACSTAWPRAWARAVRSPRGQPFSCWEARWMTVQNGRAALAARAGPRGTRPPSPAAGRPRVSPMTDYDTREAMTECGTRQVLPGHDTRRVLAECDTRQAESVTLVKPQWSAALVKPWQSMMCTAHLCELRHVRGRQLLLPALRHAHRRLQRCRRRQHPCATQPQHTAAHNQTGRCHNRAA
jgi:hypothetical protein